MLQVLFFTLTLGFFDENEAQRVFVEDKAVTETFILGTLGVKNTLFVLKDLLLDTLPRHSDKLLGELLALFTFLNSIFYLLPQLNDNSDLLKCVHHYKEVSS